MEHLFLVLEDDLSPAEGVLVHLPNTVNLTVRTTTPQTIEAVQRKAPISGALTVVSLNSRLESNKDEEEGPFTFVELVNCSFTFVVQTVGSQNGLFTFVELINWSFTDMARTISSHNGPLSCTTVHQVGTN